MGILADSCAMPLRPSLILVHCRFREGEWGEYKRNYSSGMVK